MVTAEHSAGSPARLPRTEEAPVRDRIPSRVGRLSTCPLPHREGARLAIPKEERDALVAAEPAKFLPPDRVDERYHWVQVRLALYR